MVATGTQCHSTQHSKELLKQAKQATAAGLRSQSGGLVLGKTLFVTHFEEVKT